MSVVDIVHISIMRHSYTGGVSTASLYMQKGRTERSNRLPAHRLFDDSVDVRQLVAHVEVGKAVASNNRNDLCLSFLLHSGVAQHREEEGLDGRDGLTNNGERKLFARGREQHTVSAPPAYATPAAFRARRSSSERADSSVIFSSSEATIDGRASPRFFNL